MCPIVETTYLQDSIRNFFSVSAMAIASVLSGFLSPRINFNGSHCFVRDVKCWDLIGELMGVSFQTFWTLWLEH
jgi:hypothetical protein